MIPRWIHDDAPASERRVFEKLERDPAAGNWTVLHSLGLARRRTGPYGEIDFVVVVPDEGVFCLEVKGGGVSCQNGIWRTRNRYGKVEQIKSPFMQARDNMFALRDSVRKHFGEPAAESRCLTGCAVVFPDVACPPLPVPPEVDRAQVIDCNDLSKSISGAIARCARHARRNHPPRDRGGPVLPASGHVKNLLKFLRPDFEVVVTSQFKIGRIVENLVRLTEEQIDRLDALEKNDRCLRSIAEATEVVTGVESRIRKSDGTVPELEVEHHYYRKSGLAKLLTRTVEHLTAGGTPVEDVVVLSPCRIDDPQKSGLAGIERIAGHPLVRAEPGAESEPGAIRVSTISRFKGLESNVVVMVNVDAMDGARNESLLYVGMTRARALLVLLIADTTQARGVWEPRFQEMARRATPPAAGGPGEAAWAARPGAPCPRPPIFPHGRRPQGAIGRSLPAPTLPDGL